jgi:hypothetical protein
MISNLGLDGAPAMQMKPMGDEVLVFITKGVTFPILLYKNIVKELICFNNIDLQLVNCPCF